MMGHALPYYEKRIAAQGYAQVQDLLAYEYPIHQPFSQEMQRIIARAQQKHNFRFRPARYRQEAFFLRSRPGSRHHERRLGRELGLRPDDRGRNR